MGANQSQAAAKSQEAPNGSEPQKRRSFAASSTFGKRQLKRLVGGGGGRGDLAPIGPNSTGDPTAIGGGHSVEGDEAHHVAARGGGDFQEWRRAAKGSGEAQQAAKEAPNSNDINGRHSQQRNNGNGQRPPQQLGAGQSWQEERGGQHTSLAGRKLAAAPFNCCDANLSGGVAANIRAAGKAEPAAAPEHMRFHFARAVNAKTGSVVLNNTNSSTNANSNANNRRRHNGPNDNGHGCAVAMPKAAATNRHEALVCGNGVEFARQLNAAGQQRRRDAISQQQYYSDLYQQQNQLRPQPTRAELHLRNLDSFRERGAQREWRNQPQTASLQQKQQLEQNNNNSLESVSRDDEDELDCNEDYENYPLEATARDYFEGSPARKQGGDFYATCCKSEPLKRRSKRPTQLPPPLQIGYQQAAAACFADQASAELDLINRLAGTYSPQRASDYANRSYSFVEAASQTTKSRRKSNPQTPRRNPLAAIFNLKPHEPFEGATLNRRANTIHLSSAKSHQSLAATTAAAAAATLAAGASGQRNGHSSLAGGSLKRIKSAPLTAHQVSYEAMRTIDMYLIRQIARSCMDFEIEQKIDLEIRLRELAAQSMLEAQDEIDVLEVEKSLLASDQRMNCYATRLEQQRKQLSNPSLSADSGHSSGPPSCRRGKQQNDVVGPSGSANDTSSPTFSSPASSESLQQTPRSPESSKLSPISGQSANSPSSGNESSSATSDRRRRTDRSNKRAELLSSTATTATTNNNNTLNRNRHRTRNKKREQRKQAITSASNINCNVAYNNKASLSFSELRIPLMWRDVDHFKGRGDYKRYAVFCLLKLDSQIYDTRLITNVDRQMTDVTFDDVILFNEVDHEFELTLEVYSCVYLEQFSFSSTPRKLKEKLSNSIGRAMGRRLASQTASANYTKELQAYDKSYRFAMIASATLRLEDATNSVKTYDLVLVSPSAHHRSGTCAAPPQAAGSLRPNSVGQKSLKASQASLTSSYNNSSTLYHQTANQLVATGGTTGGGNQKDAHKNTLPLFGHFCCKLQVKPDVFDKYVRSGYLRVANLNTLTSLATSNNQTSGGTLASRRSDSPNGSSFTTSSGDSVSYGGDSASMLRSALAASSKLATLSMSTSVVHWALLRNFTLHLWPIEEQKLELALRRGHAPQVDISRRPPFSMNIDKYSRLLRVSNSSLTIETDKGCFVLAVYNQTTDSIAATTTTQQQTIGAPKDDEIGLWLRTIEQMIYDSHIWGSVLNHYPPQQNRPQHQKQRGATQWAQTFARDENTGAARLSSTANMSTNCLGNVSGGADKQQQAQQCYECHDTSAALKADL